MADAHETTNPSTKLREVARLVVDASRRLLEVAGGGDPTPVVREIVQTHLRDIVRVFVQGIRNDGMELLVIEPALVKALDLCVALAGLAEPQGPMEPPTARRTLAEMMIGDGLRAWVAKGDWHLTDDGAEILRLIDSLDTAEDWTERIMGSA
jgi:hypothetical protein